MKSYKRFQHFHNTSPIWVYGTRFFFLIGVSIWLGSLIFFAAGVAPVHFQIAEVWQLQGVDPVHGSETNNYRAVGGALTQASLDRLQSLEIVTIILATIGILMAWIPRHNRNGWLIAQTLGLAIIVLIYIISHFVIWERMIEIQSQFLLDFSINNPKEVPAHQQEFNELHTYYTQLTTGNVILLMGEILLFTINPLAKLRNS